MKTTIITPQFTCCFMNCKNLYEVDARSLRTDLDQTALEQKASNLAATLRDVVGEGSPDLVGLCEVGSEAVGAHLAEIIAPSRYGSVWSGEPPVGETGLLVLYNQELFSLGRLRTDTDTRGIRARVKWMAVRLECQRGSRGNLWFVVNHWHSPMSGEFANTARANLWAEFNGFYRNEAVIDTDSMVVVGDFNCEPGDHPLVNQPDNVLTTSRSHEALKSRWRNDLFLYNPMWRFMGEADPHEDKPDDDYQPGRPLGTFWRRGCGWRMLDQMFVSRAVLYGSDFRLLERTVRISPPREGCSDHSAVGATFRIMEGK